MNKQHIVLCVLLSLALLAAACGKTTEGDATKVIVDKTTQASCAEFCPTQPHTACVGQWKISGDYPNCGCTYECTAAESTTGETGQTQEAPPAEPNQEVKSSDGKFSLRIKGTKGYATADETGFFSYRRGDRVMLCGDGVKDVKEVIFNYKSVSSIEKPKLVGYGHLFEGCYDFPLNQIGMVGNIVPKIDGKDVQGFSIQINWVK
ncbi:MAG: hypothetical protein V1743_06710 [Nanoarchaeota archaeon]